MIGRTTYALEGVLYTLTQFGVFCNLYFSVHIPLPFTIIFFFKKRERIFILFVSFFSPKKLKAENAGFPSNLLSISAEVLARRSMILLTNILFNISSKAFDKRFVPR